MAEPCKLSAMTLALRALVNNEELTRRLADIAEEGNSAALFGDALREGVVESASDANEYALKKESADIKFKAILFGGVLANTRQGDEALDLLAQEIKNTHGTAAEGLNLVELISEMDLSGLEEAARVVFNTTTEEASKIVEEMRVKISNYIGSEYSVVTSGSSIKADKVIKSLDKEIDDAVAKLDKAKELLGEKTYDDVDKDLKRLKSQPKNNSKYWSTKEGRAETNKLADKYGKPHNKRILENYLEDISEAKKIVSEQSDRLEILSKTYQDALNKDLKLIEAGQNPMEYIGADAEWKFIKGFDNSVSQRAKQYGQYALARTLLTDGGDIPQSVYDVLVKTVKGTTGSGIVNYLDEPLTEDWLLSEDRTLEELLTRAYTNTKQLVSDGNLRTIYRQQLIALASDGELAKQDVEYIESLLNTMKLSEVGAGFSDVLKYNSLLQNAKDLGLDVSKYNGATLRRDITDFLEEDVFDTLLKRGNTITLKKGLQMTHRELLELVSNMAGSLELKKAIATNQWTDNDLLRVAAKYLIGDVVDGAKRLKDLIGVAKENPVTDDIRGVILKAITGKNVPEKTKVAFFDFRKELTAAEDVKFRAEYLDKLSDANKIEIPNATIPEVTTTSVDGLISELSKDEWKGGYLMVNDSQRKLNEVLEQALYNVNYGRKAEDRIQILYPKGGLMGQFRSEGGNLIFRTPYSSMFDEFLQTVALRTFGQAGGDSKFTKDLIDKLTKGDLDAISEVNKTLEEDARRYYGRMLGRDAYDEKLIPMLEEATGISFKNYDSIVDKVAFWKRVDDRFMLEGKVLGKYTQDVVTVSDVLKDIDALTPESIAAELTQRFGYEIPVSQITENGVIKPGIKTAYTNYKLSQTPLELLERKGKLLAVINGGTADNIATSQFRSMIQSGDFGAYKEIFFHDTEFSDEDLRRLYKQINDMIFDNLGAQVADNLVDMGYRLPLVNIRDLIYDWAKGTLDANNGFARAFLAKNNLDPTLSTLNSIIDEAIPNELRFSYDEGVSIIDPNIHFMTRSVDIDTMIPTKGELDEYLSSHNITKMMKEGLGTTDNIEDAIFITADGEFIDGIKFRGIYDIAETWGSEVQVEHYSAIDAIVFNDWTRLGHLNEWSEASQTILPTVMDKENLIRMRYFPEKKQLILSVSNQNLTEGQKRRLSDILKDINEYGDGRIDIDGPGLKWGYTKIIEPGQKINISDIEGALKTMDERFVYQTDEEILERNKKIKFYGDAEYITDINNPLSNDVSRRHMRRLGQYSDQLDMAPTDAMKVQMFTKDRTWKQIAKAYGFPIKIVQGDMIEGVKAYGAYGNGIIYFTDIVKESTPPHELFHAVFNTYVGKEQYDRILSDSSKLFQVNRRDAEELLANSFADWFKTGKFTYGDSLKAITGKNLTKEQKTFLQKVKDFFIDLAETLGLVDRHRAEVEQLFKDIVDVRVGIDTTVPDYIYRLSETTNEFMQDTYSSLVAMSAIRDGVKLPNAGHEKQILQEMLNDYYQAFKDATAKGKTLSFKEAQDLKTRMGYALDMFEQNYLAPQYQRFLTPDEKSELFGLKYALGVTTNSDGLNTIREYNSKIMNRYTSATNRVLDRAELITSSLSKTTKSVNEEIEERQQELINQGATMKVVDGQPVVVDMRSELSKQLQNIPGNIIGLEQLKILGRSGLERLSNEEIFFLLNVVELAKNAENKMNLITKTIYKVSPQLAKVDFFNTFKAVDGLPKALHGNLLNGGEALAKYTNTEGFDKEVKKDIFGKIKNKFRESGQLSYDELSKIIKDSIDTNIKLLANTVKGSDLKVFKKEASMIYQGAFNLYTLLKDVPKGVKESIDEILNEQKKGIIAALDMLGDNNKLPEIMDAISIVASDGTVKTFRQILDGEEANLSKVLFDEETNVIKTADEAAQETIDRSWKESKQKKVAAENKITVEKVNNNYRDGLQAYLNKMEVASQAERDLINTTWTAAREIAKQYTLTNKLADTDNALASMNEAIMRDFKSGVLGFLGNITQGGQLVKWLGNIGDNITDDVMKKWDLVRDRYRTLYSMSTEQLNKFEPKNIIDGLAMNLAIYFKEIESRLGSIDGLTGGTTSREVNRAFAHLGEVVLNIDSVHALFSLMSGVEGNQILKFFRFANPQDAARVDEFIIGGLGQQYLGGYRNFVDTTDQGFDREWFNKTFASNLSEMEYRKLIQALCGFTITSPKFRWLEQIFNFVNQSNYLFRTLMSYPGQLVTIHPQTIAYWLKQTGWEKELQAEDLGAIDAVRRQTGILNTTYNEINLFRYASPDSKDPTAFFNRYGLPDVDDLMDKEKFYTSDDISSIYSKIDNYGSQGGIEARFNKFLRNTDAYKDNANNIIDGFFARNFKNIAFLKALQSNNYMKLATAEQFARFMASDAPEAMKKKLMEAVAESSGRNFRNILGLGFSGLDRAVGGSWERNIWIGLMQMFNFRGAWGQNIARQTWNRLSTSLYMAKNGLSKEGRDAMALYIAKQPEWTNFVTQLFNDLKYSWELVKFQDNGDWDPTDDDLSIIDFIQYAYETMQFSSQWRQGIQSYGTTRILGETIGSAVQTAVDPEIYKDTLGIGAFMNALSKNLGRNWKVPNLMVKTLGQNGRDEKWAYLGNEFWKLSFGTLRYLMNEDETSYGYSTELVRGRPGAIPFVISGETSEDGDKAFSYDLANTETWLNLVNWREADDPEMARAYVMNNLDSFFNASQLLGIIKNIGRGVASSSLIGDKMKGWLADDLHVYKFGSPFDLAEIGDIVYDTEAGHDFIRYGQYRPTDARDVKILIDEVIGQANHRPGNDGFNKSMFDFDKSDHMASLESSNSADAFMELLLSNIKYERDDNFNFIVDDKGKKIETNYWKTHMADMMRHMNDNDYMTNSNYEFINTWVETNNDDPNYMLYRRLISEGLAGRYATQQINSLIDQHNKIHGYKGSEKLNLTKLKNSGIYDVVYPNLLGQETLITGEKTDFLTAIMQLDKAATQSANIKMIERQLAERGDNETIQKLFNINKKGEISLGTKYESYLKEQAKLSQALNEGDVDKFIAETSGITRMFRDEDPYGLMTTTLIASRISRINNADTLSVEQKAKAIDALFTDNYDFIQTHIPQLIETIGNKDLASDYVAQMNNSLYDISYIGDKLIADSEMANSKSGRSSAVSVSTKAKDLLGSLGKSTGNGDGVGGGKNYDYNITPVKLDGAKLLKMTGAKGYTPQSSSEAIQAYKAHADFSLKKDINREVKGPKTQTISSKKQLSNLESKTTKALEAES